MDVARIRFEALHPRAVIPTRSTPDSIGLDAVAVEDVMIGPGDVGLVPLGFRTEFSSCIDAQIRSRSGLALKHKVVVLNSPGTIDADYRGEWKVILMNHGTDYYTVRAGDRVAQIVFLPGFYPDRIYIYEEAIAETARGSGGFGSTGV